MLMVFFIIKEFVRMNLFPEHTSPAATYFVDNVMISLASRRAQQRGDINPRKLRLHFGDANYDTAWHVQEQVT
jgi:hypothetical protein